MPLRLSLACAALILISLARFAPTTRIDRSDARHPEGIVGNVTATARVAEVRRQYSDPWCYFGSESYHQSGWRILIPAAAHWTRLPLSLYFLLPRLGGMLLAFLAAGLAWRETHNELAVAAVCALTVTSSAFFVAVDWIQFDPFWGLALLVYAFADTPLAVFACAALGPWIDERFILILPAVACLRLARGRRTVLPTLLGIAPYLAVRLALLLLGDPSVKSQIAIQRIFCPWFPVGWGEGFRLGWLLVAAGLVFALRRHRLPATLTLLGGLGTIAWLAADSSRSIAVLLPFLVQGAIVFPRHRRAGQVLAALTALNFVLPAGHVVADAYFPITPVWTPPNRVGYRLGSGAGEVIN